MRLDRLRLERWGHYEADATVTFPLRVPDLHLVYGANEAGKSTLLRALRAVFLDLPRAPVDDHRWGAPALALRAEATLADGRPLHWTRTRRARGGTTATLDGAPLDAAGLAARLGHVDEVTWAGLYGFSGADLAAGAERLAELRLGELLFGEVDPLRARAALAEQAERLLSPSGRGKREINEGVGELDRRQKEQARAEVSAAEWERRARAVAEAEQAVADRRAARDEAARAAARLERQARAWPLLNRLQSIDARLAELPEVPGVGPDAEPRFLDLLARRSQAAAEAEAAREGLADADAEHARLAVDAAVLDRLPALRAAAAGREAMLAEAQALARESAELGADRQEADDAVLAHLGGEDAEALDRLPLADADLPGLDALGRDEAALTREGEALERDERELARDAARLEEEARPLGAAVDPEPLREWLAEVAAAAPITERAGRAAATRDGAALERERLRERLAAAWPADRPQPIVLPSLAAVDERAAEEREGAARLDEARRDLAEVERELDRLRADLAAHRAERSLPEAGALEAARRARGEAWARVRAAWLDGAPVDRPAAVAEALERAVAEADAVADALWRDATAVSERRGLEARLAELAAVRERRAAAAAAARREVERAARAWVDRWAGSGLVAAPPDAMRRWLEDFDAWRRAGDDVARAEAEAGAAEAELAALGARGDVVLAAAGLASGGSLVARAERARRAVADAEADRRRREQVAAGRSALADRRADLEARRAAWECRRAAHREALPARLRALGLRPTLPVAEAPAWAREALRLRAERRKLARRGEALAARREALRTWEAGVAEAVGPLAPEVPADAASRSAWAAATVRRAEEALRERARLERERPARAQALVRREAELAAIAAAVAEALRAAGVEEEGAYRERAGIARERADLAAVRHTVLAELRGLREGDDAAAFDAEALARPLAALQADHAAAVAAARGAEEGLEAAVAGLQAARGALATIDGSARAAELAAQVAQDRERVREGVRRWLVLVAARRVLDATLARFEREQAPALVSRMSELFRRLTEARYQGIEREGEGAAGLRALRADGVVLDAASLSEGTSQQLYLAARLAWAEHHARAREPLPLVLDDVLAAFDDQRARAALRVLAEVASRQQVLLLTHHHHVVELAREAVPELVPIALGAAGG